MEIFDSLFVVPSVLSLLSLIFLRSAGKRARTYTGLVLCAGLGWWWFVPGDAGPLGSALAMIVASVIFVGYHSTWQRETADCWPFLSTCLMALGCIILVPQGCATFALDGGRDRAFAFFEGEQIKFWSWDVYDSLDRQRQFHPFLRRKSLRVIPPGSAASVILVGRDNQERFHTVEVLFGGLGTFPDRLEGLYRTDPQGHSIAGLSQFVRAGVDVYLANPQPSEFWEEESLGPICLNLAKEYLGQYGQVLNCYIKPME